MCGTWFSTSCTAKNFEACALHDYSYPPPCSAAAHTQFTDAQQKGRTWSLGFEDILELALVVSLHQFQCSLVSWKISLPDLCSHRNPFQWIWEGYHTTCPACLNYTHASVLYEWAGLRHRIPRTGKRTWLASSWCMHGSRCRSSGPDISPCQVSLKRCIIYDQTSNSDVTNIWFSATRCGQFIV